MEADLLTRIDSLEKKIDAIYVSVEKTRKYIYWTIVGTIVASIVLVVLPLIGLFFAIPSFLNTLSAEQSIQGF